MGYEHGTAECHFIAVLEYDIHLRWRELGVVRLAESRLGRTAAFDGRDIAFHDHVFGARELFDLGTARAMVRMRVADQKDLDVRELEAQLLHARADERDRFLETAVDEDVSFWSRNEVRREILG